MKDYNINPKEIKGYNIEAKTHSAVATAIAMKKADIGLGIRTVAEQYNLAFIPLANEHYDFLIRKERFNDEDVQNFIKALKLPNYHLKSQITVEKLYGRIKINYLNYCPQN